MRTNDAVAAGTPVTSTPPRLVIDVSDDLTHPRLAWQSLVVAGSPEEVCSEVVIDAHDGTLIGAWKTHRNAQQERVPTIGVDGVTESCPVVQDSRRASQGRC